MLFASLNKCRHGGFTLIELLVVMAIIGILTGLVLPAVQSSRESARRLQCDFNFKQVGLALQNYHSTSGSFPIGRTGLYYTYQSVDPNRRTWVLSIMPYIEQTNSFGAFNFALSFYEIENSTVVRSQISIFLCPSDQPGIQEPESPVPRSKGNIAANWGNSHYFQGEPGRGTLGPNPFVGPLGTVSFSGAPFAGNVIKRDSNFLDGMSSTLLAGEVIVGQNRPAGTTPYGAYDHRGDIYNDDRNGTMFMTYTPPNSLIPDQLGDPVYCGNGLDDNPPCNSNNPCFNASRSRHRGGVLALFGDGSTRFIKDAIDQNVWRALGSPSGREVVSTDQY